MEWRKDDPRESICEQATIIIIIVFEANRHNDTISGIGNVETKDGWSITTNMEWRRVVTEDDKWPDNWMWCHMPERK